MSISVVICTYNRVESLRGCVNALFSVETNHDWELIIVDNSSTDGTQDFLNTLPKQFGRARVITGLESKRGSYAARNKGVRLAKGDIVAFTDDDCYVFKDYIDKICSAFHQDAKIGFIGGRVLLYDQRDLRMTIEEGQEPHSFEPRTFIRAGAVHGCNMAFRRETLDRIGGFDENFLSGGDIDAVASALWAGISGAYDPEVTVYHHHGRQTRVDAKDLLRKYDKGRGAYYVKHMVFNRDSRFTYAKMWLKSVKAEFRAAIGNAARGRRPSGMQSLRELLGGMQYLWFRYRNKSLIKRLRQQVEKLEEHLHRHRILFAHLPHLL
jgi:GT2 family glycosyltransferase